ncbi:GntR family transcriptional regulator [Aeromicrobium sp. CF4.19]|uniref:GntR family transcriptional regulator n=1 Tax=Aeromicrobium sp. CF4.19 TaxID=3373082 RepID=UPI003EE5C380
MAARLREDVANGVITPGALIKQTLLAKRYGVSPTPVREAMRILEADGVITYSPHRGASVREMTPETAMDLYRLRSAAEGEAAHMAVGRMTPDGVAAVQRAFDALTTALDLPGTTPAEMSVLNREFHFAIYEHSSPLVVQFLELLWSRFTPPATLFADRAVAQELHEEHRDILQAVMAGDAHAARQLTSDHIQGASHRRARDPRLRAVGTDVRENFDEASSQD